MADYKPFMDAVNKPFMDAVKGNNIDTVRTIISAPGFDINKAFRDEHGAETTPLQYATVNGTEQIIKVLLSQPGIVIDPVSILTAIEMRFAFIFSYVTVTPELREAILANIPERQLSYRNLVQVLLDSKVEEHELEYLNEKSNSNTITGKLGDKFGVVRVGNMNIPPANGNARAPEPPSIPKNVYLISGHGYENPVEYGTRFRLPADVWVSTFQECGKETFVEPCSFNAIKRGLGKCALFQPTKPNMIKSTIDFYKAQYLGIHHPGDLCPHMYINLCSQDQPYNIPNIEENILNYRLLPSGIIKFPRRTESPNYSIVKFNKLTDADIPAKMDEIKKSLSDMYEESLLPTKSDVLEWYNDTIETLPGINTLPVFTTAHTGFLDRLGKHFKYFIGDIIAKFGKGKYDVLACRAAPGANEGRIERIREASLATRRLREHVGALNKHIVLPRHSRTRRRGRGRGRGRGRSLTRRANSNK